VSIEQQFFMDAIREWGQFCFWLGVGGGVWVTFVVVQVGGGLGDWVAEWLKRQRKEARRES